MSLFNNIKRNSFFSLLTHFIRLFANFFIFIGIARSYGPIEFGQFTAAHTLSTIFLLFADFGFDTLLVTEIAHNKEKIQPVLYKLFSMKIILASLATISMLVVISFEPVSSTTRMLMYLFSLNVLFSSVMNFFFYVFRGLEEFQQETRISFFMNTFLLIVIVVFSFINVSLVVIAVAFIITRLIGVIIAIKRTESIFNWKNYRFVNIDKSDFLKINVFGLYGIFGTILFTIDTILLSNLTNDNQVGLYQSVIKIASLGLLASDILVYSILPSLTHYFSESHVKWFILAKYSHRILLFIGIFISFFMIVFPGEIIAVIYGTNKYADAIPILRVFGCTIAIRYFSEAGGLLLTSSHHQTRRLFVVIIATVFNVCSNLFFIPRYGIKGAAIISLLTNVIVGAGYLINCDEFRKIWSLDVHKYFPLLIAFLLGLLFWNDRLLNAWISIPFSMIILSLSIIFIGFNKDERIKIRIQQSL